MAQSALVVQSSDATFAEDVLKAPELVLVDVWAAWCGPCRSLAPLLDLLAEQYKGRVKVVKLDADANPLTPAQYEVQALPTLLLFRGGELVDRLVGNPGRLPALARFVEQHEVAA